MTMPDSLKGLLDINVLVAHALIEHEHHREVVEWHRSLTGKPDLFSCPITELGLVRNLMRMLNLTMADARRLLENERENLRLALIPDTLGADVLPDWIQGYRQTTNAYLRELAQKHKLCFITLDKRIPGTFSILAS